MKLRNRLCILILAALLGQLLAGCASDEPVESGSVPDVLGKPVQSHRVRGPEEPGEPDGSDEPESTPEVDQWDPEHRLDFDFKPANGLELPVTGATGYATVKLPLWEELPEEEQGKLVTVYNPPEPSPEPSPRQEPSPEPSEEPSPEPGQEPPPPPEETPPEPAEETEPVPEEIPEEPVPEAGEPAAHADGEGEDPLPTESASDWLGPFVTVEPTEPAEDSPEPEPEPTPESTPIPFPEPGSEAGPEPEPEPSEELDPMAGALMVLKPGTAFTILKESGDWWEVEVQENVGWVEHRYCLINLPDVVPSIVYNDTNSYSSIFVSSGRDIPNVTGKALYEAQDYNPRLGRSEFMMPVLYAMARNVCRAQQNALAEGNTIVLYEGYRPYSAQMAVVRNLSSLSRVDSAVRAGISTAPWNISWFIATGSSNHQEGYAMDVSLAKVLSAHEEDFYGYNVVQVEEYEEYIMPTAMHELSMAAITFTRPVTIFSTTAWRNAEMAPAMAANKPARALQRYCTDASLTPLASEWWHFNDLAAYNQIRIYHSTGEFEITQCLSRAP